MNVREFKIINELGQEYSLMNIKNYCLFTDPSGLGISYDSNYEQIGNVFVENEKKIEQKQIIGTANFSCYDNYKKMVDFLIKAKSLKFSYKIPFKDSIKEYFRDISFRSIEKSEKQTSGVLSETLTLDALSLWYEENETIYDMKSQNNEMRYDYRWDSRYTTYNRRSVTYNNEGHVEAPFRLEISGYVENPSIQIFVNKEKVSEITIPITIGNYEKFLYCSKANETYIRKQNADGTLENLFKKQYVDIKNDNIFRLPLGVSEIKIVADNEIANAKLIVYPQYKAV